MPALCGAVSSSITGVVSSTSGRWATSSDSSIVTATRTSRPSSYERVSVISERNLVSKTSLANAFGAAIRIVVLPLLSITPIGRVKLKNARCCGASSAIFLIVPAQRVGKSSVASTERESVTKTSFSILTHRFIHKVIHKLWGNT